MSLDCISFKITLSTVIICNANPHWIWRDRFQVCGVLTERMSMDSTSFKNTLSTFIICNANPQWKWRDRFKVCGILSESMSMDSTSFKNKLSIFIICIAWADLKHCVTECNVLDDWFHKTVQELTKSAEESVTESDWEEYAKDVNKKIKLNCSRKMGSWRE